MNKVCSNTKKWICEKPKPEPEPEPERHYPRAEPEPSSSSRGTSLLTNPIKRLVRRSLEAEKVATMEEEMMHRFETLSLRQVRMCLIG